MQHRERDRTEVSKRNQGWLLWVTLNAECGWNLGFISAWNCFSWLCSVSLLCSEAWSSEANIFKGKLCSGGLHACKSWFSFIWALDEPSLACFWSVLKMSKNNPSKQHLISLFGLLLPSELASQLAAAESRYSLLEKQLDYMRKMIQHAEREKTQLLEKQVSSQDYLRIKWGINIIVWTVSWFLRVNAFERGCLFELAFIYLGVNNFPT